MSEEIPLQIESETNSQPALKRLLFAIGEDHLFLFLAVVIGILSALAVVAFRFAIFWTQALFLSHNSVYRIPRVIFSPVAGGIIVALLVIYAFPRVRGTGVNQTKAAVYVRNGYVPFGTVIGKFICCALAIGSGHSLGPEDPSLQMGAGIASKIGRSLKLSQAKLRLIAPVGAAAGLAAAFNAPISAVLFVIEEIIGTWSAGVLGAIVLAAVSSVVTMRWFLGADALFHVPAVQIVRPAEYLAYVALGIVGGIVSLLFLKWIEYARPRLQALPAWTEYFSPAIAGLLIGLIGIKLPQVMGAGYPVIEQALLGSFTWKFLLLLAVVKLAATGISFLSGTPGGLFAPTLFIGAMLGGAVGVVEHHFFPSISGTVATFAIVGMGTLFAGFLRIPITSIFMVMEVSGSYTSVLPVMVSALIAYLISRRYHATPLFDMLSRQDGMILPSIEEQREQNAPVVEDAIRADSALAVVATEPLADLVKRIDARPDAALFLHTKTGEWHLLDKEDVRRLAADGGHPGAARDVRAKGPIPVIFPDEPLSDVLRWAEDWPILPVVSRADLDKLEGAITLPDVLRAFRQASTK